MGGRGSSSGVSNKGRKYGTEFTSLYQSGNIKFVRYNDSKSAKTPQETMTSGRVYVTVDSKNELKAITYYDKGNKRFKQVDLSGNPHIIDGERVLPHTHHGYNHNENDDKNGAARLTSDERAMVDKVKSLWYNYISRE